MIKHFQIEAEDEKRIPHKKKGAADVFLEVSKLGKSTGEISMKDIKKELDERYK